MLTQTFPGWLKNKASNNCKQRQTQTDGKEQAKTKIKTKTTQKQKQKQTQTNTKTKRNEKREGRVPNSLPNRSGHSKWFALKGRLCLFACLCVFLSIGCPFLCLSSVYLFACLFVRVCTSGDSPGCLLCKRCPCKVTDTDMICVGLICLWFICLSVCFLICPSVCLFVCLFVCMFVCKASHLWRFPRMPTSQEMPLQSNPYGHDRWWIKLDKYLPLFWPSLVWGHKIAVTCSFWRSDSAIIAVTCGFWRFNFCKIAVTCSFWGSDPAIIAVTNSFW